MRFILISRICRVIIHSEYWIYTAQILTFALVVGRRMHGDILDDWHPTTMRSRGEIDPLLLFHKYIYFLVWAQKRELGP